MKNKILILFVCLFLVNLGVVSAWSDNGTITQNVDGCNEINTTGATFTLTQNINIAEDCFTIIANNVTLDMNGYNITGSGSSGEGNGVYVNGYNQITVKNGYIYDFFDGGVFMHNGVNHTIDNMTFYDFDGVEYGIIFYNIDDSVINNSNLTHAAYLDGSESTGIYIDMQSDNNIIANSIISDIGCPSGVGSCWGYRNPD